MYTPTTVCERDLLGLPFSSANATFVYAGATVTGYQTIQTASSISQKTTTESLSKWTEPNGFWPGYVYTGVVYTPMATLVHRGPQSTTTASAATGSAATGSTATGSAERRAGAATIGILVALWSIAVLIGE